MDDTSSGENSCNEPRKKRLTTVELPRSWLLQGVEALLQKPPEAVGRMARIKAAHAKTNALTVDHECSDRTNLIFRPGQNMRKLKLESSLNPILNEMRLCLLASDWEGYKKLLLILFRAHNLKSGYIFFVIRSCFILLLNHPNRTPELLDDFMAGCLKLNEESRRIKYLKDCFLLKETKLDAKNPKKNISSDEESEEEDEEIFFERDFNSDTDN